MINKIETKKSHSKSSLNLALESLSNVREELKSNILSDTSLTDTSYLVNSVLGDFEYKFYNLNYKIYTALDKLESFENEEKDSSNINLEKVKFLNDRYLDLLSIYKFFENNKSYFSQDFKNRGGVVFEKSLDQNLKEIEDIIFSVENFYRLNIIKMKPVGEDF